MQHYQQYGSGQSRRAYTPSTHVQQSQMSGNSGHPGSAEWQPTHAAAFPNATSFVDHHAPPAGPPHQYAYYGQYPPHPGAFGRGGASVPVASSGEHMLAMEGVESTIPYEYDLRDSDSEPPIPEMVKGREKLATATRNLMALGNSWSAQSNPPPSSRAQVSESVPRSIPYPGSTSATPHAPYPGANHQLSDHSGRSRTAIPPPLSVAPVSYSLGRTGPHDPVRSPKSSLLTPDQKKANHIQSEQKRRANIKKGYDALCDTIPALREAVKAEEEQLAQGGTGTTRKRGKTKNLEDGDKLDGRAGPRSESVVLQKSARLMLSSV
jgi:hypothetical protein